MMKKCFSLFLMCNYLLHPWRPKRFMLNMGAIQMAVVGICQSLNYLLIVYISLGQLNHSFYSESFALKIQEKQAVLNSSCSLSGTGRWLMLLNAEA